uniref:uncharacterized protein LOC122586481 n=1 Tax=Erigeron canadensis TaxID=72917 RepID=UPI001CB9309E|nr:uncharacterized protein LOC122586481 [Erigeron canadensis]
MGKSRFKNESFVKKGGVKSVGNIRANPPAGIDPQDWNKHVDFFVSEGSVRRSQVNKANRALQSDIPAQSRTSFAQRQRGIFGPITAYPSLFATWAESRQHEDGSWTSELRAKQHT